MKPKLTDKFLILDNWYGTFSAIAVDKIVSIYVPRLDRNKNDESWTIERVQDTESIMQIPQTEGNNKVIAEFLGCDLMDYEGVLK